MVQHAVHPSSLYRPSLATRVRNTTVQLGLKWSKSPARAQTATTSLPGLRTSFIHLLLFSLAGISLLAQLLILIHQLSANICKTVNTSTTHSRNWQGRIFTSAQDIYIYTVRDRNISLYFPPESLFNPRAAPPSRYHKKGTFYKSTLFAFKPI